MFALISNKKLIPSKVSSTALRYTKNVHLNGLYYEFSKTNDSYPLELAIAQIKEFDKYELIFFSDSENVGFFAIFNKTPTRKTIFIEKAHFLIQVIKYKELFSSIAIVNNTDLFQEERYQKNIESFKDIDFIAIEKLPTLIDPNKKQVLVRKYLSSVIVVVFSLFIVSVYENNKKNELLLLQSQLSNEVNLFLELNKKLKEQLYPQMPPRDIQNKQLNQHISEIENGTL